MHPTTHPTANLSAEQLPVLCDDDHLARLDVAHAREADGAEGAVLRGDAVVVPLGARTLA